MLGTVQPELYPILSSVGAFIKTVANGYGVTHITFHRSGVYDGRGLLINGNGADGLAVFVKDRFERSAGVGGFPNTSAGCSYVDGFAILSYAVDGRNTSAHGTWSQPPRFHVAEKGGTDLCLRIYL